MLGPHQLLLRQCQYIRGQSEAKIELSSLKVAGRHLARLCVALKFVAQLLAFDDFAHSGALDCGDVNERISAAIVRLNEAEALSGIKPFYCAGGHSEPFQSIEKISAKRDLAEGDSDLF
jgi:hypothetical protein